MLQVGGTTGLPTAFAMLQIGSAFMSAAGAAE